MGNASSITNERVPGTVTTNTEMTKRSKPSGALWLVMLASALLLSLSLQAQTTARTEILGVGAASLVGGDLTDPNDDGLDAMDGAFDPSWNWAGIDASHEPDFEGAEAAYNIFDNKVGGGTDKWCCDDPTLDNPVWVAVQFKSPVSLTYFTVTSGNDSPGRDPTNWAIQGSNDGVAYTDIYHFNATTVPWTERNQVVKFTLTTAAPPYTYIRYIAYETPDDLHQINEIEFFDTLPNDSDKDGMPDDYEARWGLNPNDPSDATADPDGDGLNNLGEYQASTNPIAKPVLLSTRTTQTFDTVILTFSEFLDAASATSVANYTITPSLDVTSAAYANKVVTLKTAKQTAGGVAYTIAVKGVKDLSNNEVPTGTSGKIYSYVMTKAGVLKFSYWGNAAGGEPISGTTVDELISNERYAAAPDIVGSVYSFNSRDFFPDDTHDNYGATIEGFLTPAETGDYRFFIYSDDSSQLQLSTDATEANLLPIAEETACCNAFTEPDSPRTSEPINLVAGRNYFVRLIYKEGGGGDYGQVAWRKEGDTTAAGSLTPIPGRYLSAAQELPMPSEGGYLTRTPAPDATGVTPLPTITIAHTDGKIPWTAESVTLKLDGVAVTPTFIKDGNVARITYKPASMLASDSTHTIALDFIDPAGEPATDEWSFKVLQYSGPTQDVVNSYDGLLLGTAKFTEDAGGKSGKVGDYAIDFGTVNTANQSVWVYDAAFMNEATAKDELSVVAWQKLYSVNNSSLFWGNSPSSSGSERGFQAHTPWGGGTLYFDTAGCCDGATQRISASITEFPGYSGADSWWQDWHHIVLQKNGPVKEIWIDGQLFLTGESTGPLPSDFNMIYWGYAKGDAAGLTGILDDAAIYANALSESDIQKLASGTLPNAIGGTAKLLAYWDFNDAKAAVPPTLSVARTATGLTVTFTGTLQSAPAVNGPWTDETATSPAAIQATGAQKFYRTRQ